MDNNSQLLSAPIVPTASELETVNNPLAHIQAPDPILTPTIPSGIPPSIDINTLLQGDFNTGPNPAAKESNILKNGTGDYANALFGKLQDPNLTKDEFKYGRTYSYGSGYKQQNFERYYSHNKFNKLGFSPYRDNEALYNEQGSWWDDFSRMSGQWLNLAYNGAKSVWGDSYEANQAMERGMAVGTSSKDGLGSWITNFGLNTAYTVGIIGELALENVALAAVEGATFGVASPLAEVKRLEGYGKAGKALAGVGEFFKSLSSVEKAKAYYNAFNAGDKAADIAKFLNPFQNTTTFVHDLANGNSTVNKLKPLARSVAGFGSFYRDIREINLTHAESAIEGEGVAAEINQQRLDQFYAENGRMPDEKEAKAIYDAAQAGKANSMLANNLAIYATNKLVFDDLLSGLRPSSSAAKMVSGLLEGSGRKMAVTAAKDLAKGVEGVLSENIFKAGERNFKDALKDSIFKSHYSPLSSKYFYGNLGEGLQETSQEVIRAAAIEYDRMLSQDPSNVGYYATIGAIGKGVDDQFSQQGLDTFLSGYLMGSIIQGGGSALNKGMKTGKRAINSNWGKADEADAAVEETENNAINALNHVTKNALIYGKAVEANDRATMINILAKEKTAAAKAGDTKTAQDLAGLMEFKYLDHVVRGGNVKALNAHIDEMLSLEDKDLSEAYGIDISKASDAREKLSNLKSKTEGFVNIYQKVRNEYPNPYKPEMFSEQKDGELVYKDAYENELTLYRAHERMLTDIMYSNQYYTDISKRMTKLANSLTGSKFNNLVNTNSIGEAISNAAAEDISTLYDAVERKGRLGVIKEQVKILQQGDAKDKAEAKKLEKTIELLNEWDTAVDTFQVVNKLITKSGLIKDIEDQKTALKEANSDLYKVFEKYIRNVAKVKKGHVMDSHVKEAFTELRDLLSLQGDRDNAVKTINALSNPEYLQRLVNTYAEVEKISLENKAQNLKIAIAEMKKRASSNKLLNELVDMGVYIVPEDFDDLEKDYKLVTFYDEASHSIIKPGTEKYKKIESIIRKYAKNAKVGGVKDYTDTFKEVKTFEELSILIEDLENQGIDLKPYQTIIESKTKEFETPSEVFTPAPEGIPTGKAMSKSFINKGKKFGFTLEQLETMSSEEKDLIRKANTKEDIKEIIEKYQDKKMNNTIEAKKVDIERLEKEKQETLQPLIEEKEQIEKEIEEIEKNDDGSVKQEAETIDDFLKNNNITEQQLKDEENKLKNHLDELGLKLDTEYNFEDIINRIIKNVKGRFLKTVLKGINSLVGNKLKTKFVFSSVRHEDAAGQYFSHDDTIKIYIPNLSLRVFTLNKRGKEYQQETNIVEVFNKVFIHELIHAFTILKIRATETNAKLGLATIMNPSIEKERLNISRSDQKTIDSLNKIFDFLKNNELLKGEYGVSDIVELVTEALSNEGFAEKLKSIELPKELRYKTDNNNVFENIILYISKLVEDLLNLGSAYSDDNALDSIAAIINDFGISYSESDQQSFMKINKAEEKAREYFKYGKSNQSDNLGSETTKLQQLKQKLAEVNKKIDAITKRFDSQIAQKQSELKALEEQSTSAKKADIEIGKVGNTEYEVKVDGVYYQGKKLNNPENKTHRQLIEADIKRRKKEEINKPLEAVKNAKNKEDLIKASEEWIGVNPYDDGAVSMGVRSLLMTPGSFEKGKQDFIEENKKIAEIRNKQINAKYDAELDALESKPTVTPSVSDKKADIERKRQEEILDTFSPKISFEEFEKAWKKGIPVVPGTPLVDKSLTNILVDGKAYEYRYEKRSGKFYPIYPSSSLDAQSTERVEWLEKQALNINQLKGKELRKDLYQYHKGAASSLSKSDLVNYIKGTKREYILNEINVKYDTKLAALESIETQPVTEEIINEITIEQLKPGTSVTMKDNVEKIVYSNDGKNVTLLSPENFKSNKVQSKLILAKEIIKDKIKMIHTDLETEPAAEPVQPTSTPQERSESNSIVETAEADELTKTQNDIERVEGSKSDVVKQNLLDSIKKCDI